MEVNNSTAVLTEPVAVAQTGANALTSPLLNNTTTNTNATTTIPAPVPTPPSEGGGGGGDSSSELDRSQSPSSSSEKSGSKNSGNINDENYKSIIEKRKKNHREVERRRRDNINAGIAELGRLVPDCEKNKGSILHKAVKYIEYLQNSSVVSLSSWQNGRLDENDKIRQLQEQVRQLQEQLDQATRDRDYLQAQLSLYTGTNTLAAAASTAPYLSTPSTSAAANAPSTTTTTPSSLSSHPAAVNTAPTSIPTMPIETTTTTTAAATTSRSVDTTIGNITSTPAATATSATAASVTHFVKSESTDGSTTAVLNSTAESIEVLTSAPDSLNENASPPAKKQRQRM